MSNPLNLLLPSEQPRPDRWRWGTIWSLSPLRVRLDGDTEPLEGTPSRLVTYLAIGSRVYVHVRQGRTPVIVGVAGGDNQENRPPTAHVASLEVAEPAVPTGSVVLVDSFTSSTQSGDYLTPVGSRIRVEREGWVEVTAAIRWDGNDSGTRQIRVYAGGAQQGYVEDAPNHGGRFGQNLSTGAFHAEQGDLIEMRVYQNSGGTLTATPFGGNNWNTNYLRVKYLGE